MDKLRAVGEWLGIVDEADEKADAKLAEARTAQGNAATGAVAGGDTAAAAIPAMPELGQMPQVPEAPRGAMPDQATLAALGEGKLSAGLAGANMGAGLGGGLTVNMPVTLSGITDAGFAKRLLEAIHSHKGDFEKLISEIVHDQERLAYD